MTSATLSTRTTPPTGGSAGRIGGLDLARCIAFLGMVVVNYRIAISVDDAGYPNWMRWIVSRMDGRFSAMFIILAGMGVTLMARRAWAEGDEPRKAEIRRVLLKRALFLFVVGLAFSAVWPADILHFYGTYMLLGVFLLDRPTRTLLWGVAGLVVLAGAVGYWRTAGYGLPEAPMQAASGNLPFWAALRDADVWTLKGFVRDLAYSGFHPLMPWAAFFVLGMALGRLDLRSPRVHRAFVGWGLAAAVAGHSISELLRVRVLSGDRALFGVTPYPPGSTYLLAASGTACVFIGLACMASARWSERSWCWALSVTGQAALTLYLAHILILVPLQLTGFIDAHPNLGFALQCSAASALLGVGVANLLRTRWNRGPVELLMRRFSGS